MSAQKSGLHYLASYSGALKIFQEVLNISLLITGSLCGYIAKTLLINILAIYAFGCSGIFFIMHLRSVMKNSNLQWNWIECTNGLLIVILFVVASSLAISELTRGFIITGIIGFITAMVYMLDTVDKYKQAVTPRANYVWNTPNMPL